MRLTVGLLVVVIGGMPGCKNSEEPGSRQSEKPSIVDVPRLRVGHLVGICMSPLFLADAKGYFKEEGLDVELVFMPNPGDSVSALTAGAVQFIHNPFTNTYVAASNGARLRIIAGSGNCGLVCIVQKDAGIRNLEDLKARKGTGLKVGSERINTLELTLYRTLKNLGLNYNDFNMVWFTDHFAMLSAFKAKQIEFVTHVEPYATELIEAGGIMLTTSCEAWGQGAPDCVVSVTQSFLEKHPEIIKKYLRAIYRADCYIKANMADAVSVLDHNHYYRVTLQTLMSAIPRQPPGVDLRPGEAAMKTAIDDMFELEYIATKPSGVVDLSLLGQVISEYKDARPSK